MITNERIAINQRIDKIIGSYDEIITTLELNGGGMETLTQLLHDAAMSL